MKEVNKMQLNVGNSVGQINKTSSGEWKLYEDKINKITITKKVFPNAYSNGIVGVGLHPTVVNIPL